MDNKKRTFLLAVPLLVLGTAVGLGWLLKHRVEKNAYAA